MNMIELFSGCGGLAKGMENGGFHHLALVEFNHQACESLRRNFNPEIVHETDVRYFDFSPYKGVEAIAGGPPCQPFSLGGLARAYEDKRDMFPQAIRAISELHPRGFVFENVKGLLRKSFSDYFEYILLRLTYPTFSQGYGESWTDHLARLRQQIYPIYNELKYRVQYKLLNAADYGVPQVRERVFIVGIRDDVPGVWSWPEPILKKEDWLPVSSVLSHIPDPESKDNPIPDHLYVDGARPYPGHTGSSLDEPSKTIKAGAHGVPGGENMIRFQDGSVRYYTVYEAKQIQTFPPDYVITGPWGEAMRQIGNAVPVQLATIVGRQLFKTLSSHGKIKAKFPVDAEGNPLLFNTTMPKDQYKYKKQFSHPRGKKRTQA